MISLFDHTPSLGARSPKSLAFSLMAAALALQGCVAMPPVQMRPVYLQPTVVAAPVSAPAAVAPVQAAPAEVDLMPPVPSFTTLADCESAYGPSTCGSGQAVYVSVGLAAPVAADSWFIPYAFGGMTGVLDNHYFAPPTAFVQGVDYHSFTAPGVVNGYKTINKSKINSYNKAPAGVRSQLARSGPARYSPSRGVITGKSTLAASNSSRAAPTHSTGTSSTGSGHASAAAAGSPSHGAVGGEGLHGNAHASNIAHSPGNGGSNAGRRMTQSQGARAQQARPQQARSAASGSLQPHPAMSAPRSGAMPAARPQARPASRTQRVSFHRP